MLCSCQLILIVSMKLLSFFKIKTTFRPQSFNNRKEKTFISDIHYTIVWYIVYNCTYYNLIGISLDYLDYGNQFGFIVGVTSCQN